MNKPTKPNITIPESFAENGIKTDFDNEKLTNGFDRLQPDILAGDNLNKFIDDTYKGLNYGIAAGDAINLIQEGETLTVQNGQLVSGSTGGGLEVCDIGMALYVDETKGLRRYLNGQIVDINTNTQAWLNRLLEIQTTNPDYFTTEENWQSEALLNIDGCVYKFVLNYSGETVVSVRLPKYTDYVEINAGGTLPVVGNGMALGLTDGTTNYGLAVQKSGYTGQMIQPTLYGQPVGTTSPTTQQNISLSIGITTDPTKSGIQTTLKQTKLKMRYFIQIATGSETENNIINEIELNNPYSLFDSKYSDHELNNLSWLKSEGQWNAKSVYPTAYDKLLKVYNGTETVEGLSVKLSTETYTDYDFVLNTADETFRLPLKTKLASGKAVVGNGMTLGLSQNGNYGLASATLTSQQKLLAWTSAFGVQAGIALPDGGVVSPTNTTVGVTTDPTKSGMELSDSGLYLYFYVGETVQNANLIDAGRIGELVATKTDMLQASGAGMPSDKYIDLTLGASGSTYTAPANGYVVLLKEANATNQHLQIKANNMYSAVTNGSYNTYNCKVWMPVKKGDIFEVTYTTGGTTKKFLFIYAEGAKND